MSNITLVSEASSTTFGFPEVDTLVTVAPFDDVTCVSWVTAAGSSGYEDESYITAIHHPVGGPISIGVHEMMAATTFFPIEVTYITRLTGTLGLAYESRHNAKMLYTFTVSGSSVTRNPDFNISGSYDPRWLIGLSATTALVGVLNGTSTDLWIVTVSGTTITLNEFSGASLSNRVSDGVGLLRLDDERALWMGTQTSSFEPRIRVMKVLGTGEGSGEDVALGDELVLPGVVSTSGYESTQSGGIDAVAIGGNQYLVCVPYRTPTPQGINIYLVEINDLTISLINTFDIPTLAGDIVTPHLIDSREGWHVGTVGLRAARVHAGTMPLPLPINAEFDEMTDGNSVFVMPRRTSTDLSGSWSGLWAFKYDSGSVFKPTTTTGNSNVISSGIFYARGLVNNRVLAVSVGATTARTLTVSYTP